MRKLLFIVLFLPLLANARTFYFSSSMGNDSYDTIQAQNPATPWKTIYKINNFTVIRTGYIAPLFRAGDTLAFKRGDVFDNGANFTFLNGAVMWWDYNDGYFEAPSGTPDHPIVFTNYGSSSLPLPNFYYTLPAVTQQKFRNMFTFSGVHDIVVDGLQFNDTRFPTSDKTNAAYTYSGILLGEWDNGGASDTSLRKRMVTNATVKNCIFSNMSFGLAGVAAINSNIINNTFTNFKATEDTIGFTDVLGGAIEGLSGFNINISNNYIKGAWSGSGRVSDCYGLGGVGLDIFWCFKNSRIAYNTFVDCSGMFEVGNRFNDSANGAQYDTFAFNKIINCGQMGYIHGTAGDVFAANNHHLYFWNNIMISNNKDRMIGNGFGDDIYGDGQSFNNFWFFRSKYLCPNDFVRSGSVTNGSAVVTISTTNIQVGSRLYDSDEIAYKEVISVGTGQVTVNSSFSTTNATYSFRVYPPISDPNWSQPTNNSLCNISGYRYVLQFPSDSSKWGLWADTMIETRNNVFYATNGGAMIYPNLHGYSKQRYFHNNNIYYVKGGFVGNATTLGGTLGTGEFQTITNLFTDTTASLPENWNLLPSNGSLSISAGTPISGFTKDFAGNTLTNPPSIGLYNYTAPAPPATNSFRTRKRFVQIP